MIEKKSFSKRKVYVGILILYILLVVIANWSLLIGENLMKWDIFDAHYPYAAFVGDAIRNGQLPLWNPMVQYGTPYYAIEGMPIWYPTSIMLGLIGYSPYMLGVDYSLHMILAGFGMFLLIKEYNKEENKYLGAILSGILYMFSTVFISNAEHIMIFISATWIPYIMLYIKRYLESNKKKHILISGGFATLIFLGGYPEIFAATYLCMIPYIIIEECNLNKNKAVKYIIFESTKIFIKLCICTIAGAFITLLPFVHSMLYITRGFKTDIKVQPISMTGLITAILPGVNNVIPLTGDVSMNYYYIGVITIITIIVIFYTKKQGCRKYLGIALFTFLMSQGTNLFLYTFFHKFIPLFSSFRIPGTWRCLLAIFLLIPCSMIWNEIDKEEINSKFIKIATIISSSLIGLATLILIVSYILKGKLQNIDISYLSNLAFIAGILVMLYIPIVSSIRNRQIFNRKLQTILVFICIIEVLTFQFIEFPITVASYKQGAPDMNYISSINEQYEKRNKDFELKDAKRTNTPLLNYTRDIMFNKDLDEGGYMSFKLATIQLYKNSANRQIMTQNPSVYFTNNVVSNEEVSLEKWLQNASSPAAQIHVDEPLNIAEDHKKYSIGELKNIKTSELVYEKESDTSYKINNPNVFENRYTVRMLRIYTKGEKVPFNISNTFIDSNGEIMFVNKALSENKIIDVYFPLNEENLPYKDISTINTNFDYPIEVEKVEYIEGERINKDSNISLESYKLNNIKMKVDADTEGYVVIQQAIYPGWSVYVNDKKAKLETINGAFMGVKVPQGESSIELKFMPKDFIIGLIISAIYFIYMIFSIIQDKRNGKLRKKENLIN